MFLDVYNMLVLPAEFGCDLVLDRERHVLRQRVGAGALAIGIDPDGPAFARTGRFTVAYQNLEPVSEIVHAIEATTKALDALDTELAPHLDAPSLLELVYLSAEAPELVRGWLAGLAASPPPTRPRRLTARDLAFNRHCVPGLPLADFLADRRAHKRRWLAAAPEGPFLDAPHVVVTGVSRSGTNWLTHIATCCLTTAGQDSVRSPTLNRRRRTCPLERATQAPNTTAWLDDTDLDLLDGLPRDAARRLRLFCPPGRRFVMKTQLEAMGRMEAFHHARWLMIVRDPRDVFVSRQHFFGPARLPVPVEVARLMLLVAWGRRRVEARGGLVLKYEELLANPEEGIQRIAALLDVQLDAAAVARVAQETAFRTMAGRDYGDRRDGAYLRGGSDWRTELTPRQQWLVHALCGPVLRGLGYGP